MLADEEKLSELEERIAILFKRRDELDKEAERLKMERDRLNTSVKSLREQAHKEKEKRDRLNKEVADIKKRVQILRTEIEKKHGEISQQDIQIKKERKRLPSRIMLEKQLTEIEWQLMTTPTLEMKENEDPLIEKARKLYQFIAEHEKLDAIRDERLISLADSKAVRVQIRNGYEELKKMSESSQDMHNRMLMLYKKADEERKLADEAHSKFVEVVSSIKEVNTEIRQIKNGVMKLKRAIRDVDDELAAKKLKEIEKKKTVLKEEALRKLKAGEKLSLEEMKLIYGENETENPSEEI